VLGRAEVPRSWIWIWVLGPRSSVSLPR
jgi:hypothetical protein